MVIARKGKMIKARQLEVALSRANTMSEAFDALEHFGLSNEETNMLVKEWVTKRNILASHGVGQAVTA